MDDGKENVIRRHDKFEIGYRKSDKKKEKYRKEIRTLIDERQLFVGPVQSHNRGNHRADVYNIVHPIYRTNQLTESLANCFACSKCVHIFLHLRSNGTSPFSSHSCYKDYIEKLKDAEKAASMTKQTAAEAVLKAKTAKKQVDQLRNLSSSSSDGETENNTQSAQKRGSYFDSGQILSKRSRIDAETSDRFDSEKVMANQTSPTIVEQNRTSVNSAKKRVERAQNLPSSSSSSSSDKETQDDTQLPQKRSNCFDSRQTPSKKPRIDTENSNRMDTEDIGIVPAMTSQCDGLLQSNKRPAFAHVIASTIEKFAKMALEGKLVKAETLVEHIPNDFSDAKWTKFVNHMRESAPYRTKNVKVVLNRMHFGSQSEADSLPIGASSRNGKPKAAEMSKTEKGRKKNTTNRLDFGSQSEADSLPIGASSRSGKPQAAEKSKAENGREKNTTNHKAKATQKNTESHKLRLRSK